MVNRTVKNDGDTEIILRELVVKTTPVAPGVTVTLDPNTKAIEL